MTAKPRLRVFFFDIFGTCVAQRAPVADAPWRAANEALTSETSSISTKVRSKAEKMVRSRGQSDGKHELIRPAVI